MKKILSLTLALALCSAAAMGQLAYVTPSHAAQHLPDPESHDHGRDSDSTDNSPAPQVAFPKETNARGFSLELLQDGATQMLVINFKGSSEAKLRAVLTDAAGDILATRLVTNGYEWDLYAQAAGRYQLVLLSPRDGALLARRQFVKK